MKDHGEYIGERISSRWTYFYKRFLPIAYCVFGIGMLLGPHTGVDGYRREFDILDLTNCILLGVAFYLVHKVFISVLADKVYWFEDKLIILKGRVAESVPLVKCSDIKYSMLFNPHRITLTLRESTTLGNRIIFMPARSPLEFWSCDVFERLRESILDQSQTNQKAQ